MKFIKANISIFIVFVILVSIYHSWFLKGILSAPDFPYFYAQRLGDFGFVPYAWSSILGNGLGGSTIAVLNLDTYLSYGIKLFVFMLHVPWTVASRLLFFWPFLIIGTTSSFLLGHMMFKSKTLASVSSLIYMSNTYILMIAGGGQLGLLLAYACVPMVLWSFILRSKSLFTIFSSLLILFDLRFSFLTGGMIALFWLFVVPYRQWIATFKFIFLPAIAIVGIHCFWLIPSVFGNSFALPEGYGNIDWLSYLSWAEFSKTFSLLHPNWPENIFGKGYFMRPEFLLIPILAYGWIIFSINNTDILFKKKLLFYSFIGLLGAFLAKGTNPPFESINGFLFAHVPLFNGFRDPTKYYLLTITSYSILIPFFLKKIILQAKSKYHKYANIIPGSIVLIFLAYWLYSLLPFYQGQVKGTFGKVSVPSEYTTLEKLLSSESGFSRILTVPWRHRFIFQTENHPVVDARSIFNKTDPREIAEAMKGTGVEQVFKNLAIKYVVIPHDSPAEIFLSDRKYDPAIRLYVEDVLDELPFFTKRREFKDLTVYEFTKYTGHFFNVLTNLDHEPYVSIKRSPVKYSLNIKSSERPLSVVFSEKYDSNWLLWDGEDIVRSIKTKEGLNSFLLINNITTHATVYYDSQSILIIGGFISLVFLGILLVFSYVRVSKYFHIKNQVHVLFLFISIAYIYASIPQSGQKNIFWDKNIQTTKEWKRLSNPLDQTKMLVSRFGGSEVRFNIKNTHQLHIIGSSSNPEAKAQGIEIFVDGLSFRFDTPINDRQLDVPLGKDNAKPGHEVRIRHYCASTLGPCEIALRGIVVDKNAKVLPPSTAQLKTLAILGDSITSSFGKDNFSYLLADRVGYQLHNAGVFGSTVSVVSNWDSALLRYKNDIVSYKPDVIIVFLGTNDLAHKIPLDIFEENFSELIVGIKKGSPSSVIVAMGILQRSDYSRAQVMEYSRIIESVSVSQKIIYIDPYFWLNPEELQDEVHPSPTSQKKISDLFYGNLRIYLK